RRARSLDVGVGAARAQPHEGAVGEVDDRPERLIELVRELGPHLAHGTDAQHVRELLLMAPRAFLGALALGHVFDHGEDVRELAVLVAHDGERFMRPYRIAVAPDVSFVDQQLGALAGAQLPEGAAAAHAIGLGGQLVECLLLQLFGRISQHRAQGAVGIAHTTVAVGGHDPDPRRLEDGAEALRAGTRSSSSAFRRWTSSSARLRSVMSCPTAMIPTGLPSPSTRVMFHSSSRRTPARERTPCSMARIGVPASTPSMVAAKPA